MAESIATELVITLLQKLADEAFKKYVRSQGIHSELKNLERKLAQIQDLLADASQKEVKNAAVKRWLNDLQHLAYGIDDVLDDVATEAMERELTPESGATITGKVRKLIPTCCMNLSLTHRLQPRLDRITTVLENLYKERSDLGLNNIVKDERPKNTSRGNETSLLEPNIIGREDEMEKLINKLLSNESSSKENFSVVPIVGIGGVGKTTLAKLLYNDTRVKDHFEFHAWVCISDDFDIFKISQTILQPQNKKFEDLNELQIALREKLKDKRFLIVLDDVWHEKYNDWEKLVLPFHSCAPGSKIIITTRKKQLLQTIGCEVDHLMKLSDKDALCLFALHALGVDNFDSHPTLREQGEGIVKKCDGLPLALKAVGRLMKTKTTEEDWNDVLNSEVWHLKNADEIVPALRLSYLDLSSDLRQIFAYCSLFPKDFLFDKEKLVLLWMAEGFLNQSNGTKSPEGLGHDYFEVLLSRSFFQHAPNEKSLFMMHDLMNDLATFVAGDFFLRFDDPRKMKKEALLKHRHMSFIREEYGGYRKFEAFKGAKCLRTFLATSVGDGQGNRFYLSSKILVELLPEFPMLRVLSLSHFEISEVPEVIGGLKHLRYLNLAKTKIAELPENVGNLYNLQTLILFGCKRLKKLPKCFLKLKKLRHFDISDTPLEKLPLGIGEMENLQTLTNIIIGGEGDFTITKLKGLKNLNGKICIEGLHEVKSSIDARESKLSLKKITELELIWGGESEGSPMSTLEKEVLDELEPNSNKLKSLRIKCYGGIGFPKWVGDPIFDQLVHVSIDGCQKCVNLPPLGQLPSLKELFIQGMDEVKVIGSEFTGTTGDAFPSLDVLEFRDMPSLEVCTFNSEAGFPSLRELKVDNCPNLFNFSVTTIRSIVLLKIYKCGAGVLRSLVQAASSITKLEISYISGLTDEVWRVVTEYLGAVENLRIFGCNEIRYLWESEAKASKVFVNLKELEVLHCSGLVSLGERDREVDDSLLSSLRKLIIWNCDSMEFCCCPNNIEKLEISRCSSLTRVSFPKSTTSGGQKLKELSMSNCEKFIIGINTSMLMLEIVAIIRWTNLKSIFQLSNFIHLTELLIGHCQVIESFPELQLPNLTHLSIDSCQSLKSVVGLQLQNLNSLTHLTIYNCPSIDSFPCGVWPPRLKFLEIGGLKKPISEWSPQDFPTSIVDLWLRNEDVVDFSQLSHLLPPSLTSLKIEEFDKLESLSMGLQHLTALQHLFIFGCPEMIYLPETLLPSLLSLKIWESPKLKERCNGRGSHYWPFISHIPCIKITEAQWQFYSWVD